MTKLKSNNGGSMISGRGFSPENDGVDHINIYSKSPTELGKLLSHFTHTPFTHPYFGPFYSMEGFWYFMRNGQVDDSLRYLSGVRAKLKGREMSPKWYSDFREDIMAANYIKVIENRKIHDLLRESTLPFDHYYLFASRADKQVVINARDCEWLVDGWNEIREAVKTDTQPACWVSAEKRYAK